MKKIISYLYSLILLLSASYLWYTKIQWTINYDYIRSFDIVFLAVIVALVLWLLSFVLFSSASRKKRYIIVLCIVLMIMAELWLMDSAQFFGSDLIKLVSVLWIFLSLFGSLSEKKEFVKWEYAKKVEIIEA